MDKSTIREQIRKEFDQKWGDKFKGAREAIVIIDRGWAQKIAEIAIIYQKHLTKLERELEECKKNG